MGKCIILDSETTGLPPKGEAVEIAYFEVPETILQLTKQEEVSLIYSPSRTKLGVELTNFLHLLKMQGKLRDQFHQTFMPIGDFHPRASAVNGFTKENLKGSPCISTFVFPSDVEYMIGHNILFDFDILKKPKGVKLICSKELAIKYLTKTSGKGTKGVNTLTGLIERYYPDEAKELIANAHSALQDCKLAYLLLLKILEAAPELDSFEKLAGQCTQPSSAPNLPFGVKYDSYTKQYICTFGTKHKDESFLDILKQDKGYLVWVVEKSTMNQWLKDFVKQFMIDNK